MTMLRILFALSLTSCTLYFGSDPEPATDAGTVRDTPVPPDAAPPASCLEGAGRADRAMLVRDPQVLQRFGFGRVLDALRQTAGVAAVQTSTQLFQTWMKTFGATSAPGDCNDPGLDPNGYGMVCPRVPDLALSTIDPLTAASGVTFQPVGLFNRFDLAPTSGANCGEYRIVYAMRSMSPMVFGRAFIIFEGALPNPQPQAGLRGCAPIARFWQSLDDDDPIKRADRLEAFYFTGTAVPGVPAVVRAQSYGFADGAAAPHGTGQIRTNFFLRFQEWNLREFKLRRTCTTPADCRLAMAQVPVADNPAPELFAGTHARSAELRAAFTATMVEPLSKFQIGLGVPLQFDELESVSSRRDLDYAVVANATLRTQIGARLQQLGSPARADGQPLTAQDILGRAMFQTCAGCHELANGVNLGDGPRPPSLGFVHIDEAGTPSPALMAKFLPERAQTLIDFINATCGSARELEERWPADGRFTVGGSRAGAAN